MPADTPLSDLISLVAQAPCAVPVVCEEHNYLGIISKAMLLQAAENYRKGMDFLKVFFIIVRPLGKYK